MIGWLPLLSKRMFTQLYRRFRQDTLRHSNSATAIDPYAQSPMAQKIAARESVLRMIPKQPVRRAMIRRVRPGLEKTLKSGRTFAA
jgi:hypothetical protein